MTAAGALRPEAPTGAAVAFVVALFDMGRDGVLTVPGLHARSQHSQSSIFAEPIEEHDIACTLVRRADSFILTLTQQP